jgi:hypothetical protein
MEVFRNSGTPVHTLDAILRIRYLSQKFYVSQKMIKSFTFSTTRIKKGKI